MLHLHSIANSAVMSKLTLHCQWEDEVVRGGLAICPWKLSKTIAMKVCHSWNDPAGTVDFSSI